MAFAIDEEKLNSPDMKIMDINKPPMKIIPHEKFPKMVFLHPKDKTKEHATKIVQTDDELQNVMKQGWKLKPHVPVAPPEIEVLSADYETKTA